MELGVIFGASRGNIQMIHFRDIFLTEKVVFKLTSGSYSLQMGKSFRRDVLYIFLRHTHFGIKLDGWIRYLFAAISKKVTRRADSSYVLLQFQKSHTTCFEPVTSRGQVWRFIRCATSATRLRNVKKYQVLKNLVPGKNSIKMEFPSGINFKKPSFLREARSEAKRSEAKENSASPSSRFAFSLKIQIPPVRAIYIFSCETTEIDQKYFFALSIFVLTAWIKGSPWTTFHALLLTCVYGFDGLVPRKHIPPSNIPHWHHL